MRRRRPARRASVQRLVDLHEKNANGRVCAKSNETMLTHWKKSTILVYLNSEAAKFAKMSKQTSKQRAKANEAVGTASSWRGWGIRDA